MKNPMKRIVPILLALAVIGCAVWYLFVYDRDFTRDMLISQARYYESQGRFDAATWFYDLAYEYADNDEAVAIELASQYKASGNYTKAEYTLTKAISDGGSVELYIELCKTYVEQDKLQDAVRMLDKVADPAIKAALDEMRPAAPQVDYEPNYYTQYITVNVTGDGGTLYTTTDGEYPSIREDVYTGPITLPQGETTIYALTIGENGLVSPLGLYGYTIGGVIEPVTFADPAIEAEVRRVLELDEETVIYTNDLWRITQFDVPQEATVYSDLARMIYLTDLSIQHGHAEELSCLASLTKLQSLLIYGCDIDQATLTTIAALPELTELTLAKCGLSNISPLENAHNLVYLDLSQNSIRDITAISSMASLQTLYMTNNALTDLTALNSLTNLQILNVSYNSITSIAPICTIQTLTELDVSNNLLANLGAVDNLPALTTLNVGYNSLTEVSVLGNCSALVELNISNNAISDISALSSLLNLRKFDFSYNSVTALPDWDKTIALVILDGSYNQISDLTPLRQLMCLNKVNMDYNADITDASPLAWCPNLIEVDLFGTRVIDVDMLTQQSIIVNYNPTEVFVDIDENGEPILPEEDGESQPEETE